LDLGYYHRGWTTSGITTRYETRPKRMTAEQFSSSFFVYSNEALSSSINVCLEARRSKEINKSFVVLETNNEIKFLSDCFTALTKTQLT
jgi:hypothetical protein